MIVFLDGEEVKRVNEYLDFHIYMSIEEDNRKIENSIREKMIEKKVT